MLTIRVNFQFHLSDSRTPSDGTVKRGEGNQKLSGVRVEDGETSNWLDRRSFAYSLFLMQLTQSVESFYY